MKNANNIAILASNAIAQRPESFTVLYTVERTGLLAVFARYKTCRKRMYLYYPTAAKVALISALVLKMQIDEKQLKKSPVAECLRICSENMGCVLEIAALVTTGDWDKIYDQKYITKASKEIGQILSPETLATILEWTLYACSYVPFANAIGSILQVVVTNPKATQIADTSK